MSTDMMQFDMQYDAVRYTAARLAQLGERRSAEQEAVSSNPGRTINQGL